MAAVAAGEIARPAPDDTFPKLFLRQTEARPDAPAFREKEFGVWRSQTFAEALGQIESIALGLAAEGFGRGDMLAVIGQNRPARYYSTYAAQALGGIPVPLFADGIAAELVAILNHCGARFAVVEDQEQVDKLLPALIDGSLNLRGLYFLDPRGMRGYRHDRLRKFDELVAAGSATDDGKRAWLRAEIAFGSGSDISVICYTSGTTGAPKGVMLSFDNLMSTARRMAEFEGLTQSDRTLAYLPMAWIGDHFFSFAQSCIVGFTVNCPESRATVLSDLREIAPTYFFAPPRIFEGMLTDISIRMQNAGAIKRRLYAVSMALARRSGVAILEGRSTGTLDRIGYAIGRWLVIDPLLNTLGLNRLRVAYTAGEALGPDIFDYFRSVGINLKQVYGQTESSVYVCVQANGDVRSDTVGPPAPGVEIKISPAGELLYRSSGVFVSYLNSPDAAADAKDEEGWVRSGDAAVVTERGHVRIIDRLKDVGRTRGDRLFPPKYIENKLKFFFSVKEAVAFGDGLPFATAFVNIELEAVSDWAERRKLAFTGYADLASRPETYDLVSSQIAEANASLAKDPELSHCQIRRFLILPKELDADDGELTRTRKVRRRVIAERYGPLIEALYGEREIVPFDTRATLEDGRTIDIRADVRIMNVPGQAS